MTADHVVLVGYVARALVARIAARRVPALRPVAVAHVTLVVLDALTWGPLWTRAGQIVAWPGVGLALLAWGLRQSREEVDDPATRLTISAFCSNAPRLLLLGYALAGLLTAATYVPFHVVYLVALPASRIASVAIVSALLVRRWPETWTEYACVIPAAGSAVGVLLGWGVLLPAGPVVAAAGWGLARFESSITSVLEVIAIMWAARTRSRERDVRR